jgi:DNA-directed RNA polymerase subunit RPC12/RpoP
MISFRCPECHAGIRGPDTLAGRTVNCPKCASRVSILISGGVPLATTLDTPLPLAAHARISHFSKRMMAIVAAAFVVGVAVGAAGMWLLMRSR